MARGGREHHQPEASRQVQVRAGHAGFRKLVTIDVFNEANVKALSYRLYRVWVSDYQAIPDLDAGANAVAITTIKLEYEWFDRDPDVTETEGPARG